MEGLADMMSPQRPQNAPPESEDEQALTEASLKGTRREEPRDLDGFRRGLIKQTRWVRARVPMT